MSAEDSVPAKAVLCPAASRVRTIEVLLNPLSGSVGPKAHDEITRTLGDYGFDAQVTDLRPAEMPDQVRKAVDASPDLIIILAGDGTARSVASLCGPDGPMVAPLAGGTMNMLPHALYGQLDWKAGLEAALTEGECRNVSGGEVDGQTFYVAAILGAPALWAYAREAVRKKRLTSLIRASKNAWLRMFSSNLSYALDGGAERKAEALALLCPLVSRKMTEEDALEAAVLNPKGAAEAFRLGFRTLLSEVVGDWRDDEAVSTACIQDGRVWAHGRLPAILDGEPTWLHKVSDIRFRRVAFKALAPPSAPEPVNPVTGKA